MTRSHRLTPTLLTLALRTAAVISCLSAVLFRPPAAMAQPTDLPLRLDGAQPGGLRIFATESWGVFDFGLSNRSDVDRDARLVMYFHGNPDVQYGRDVWVPAHANLRTSMLVGPVGVHGTGANRDIHCLLYDRTDGQDRLLLPDVNQRVGLPGVVYHAPERVTAVLLDRENVEEALTPGRLPQPDSPAEEAFQLVQVFRRAAKLSDFISRILPEHLPTTPQAFDGIDHVVLASNRLAHDAAGMRALRQWLEQGGQVWVMLDRVDPESVAALLGDALDFEVVDHVALTSLRIETDGNGGWAPPPLDEVHERPVDFARVLLPRGERVVHRVGGWPAWFVRRVGRGKVVFTTLGPRAWFQSRRPGDANPPAPQDPLRSVVSQMQPPPDANTSLQKARANERAPAEGQPQPHTPAATQADALKPLLNQEIGYSVAGRTTVGLIFGGFAAAALAVGAALRRARRRELLGWIGPVAALGAAVAFVGVGESSRSASPATLAVAQIVDPVSGTEEAAVHGVAAVYRPDAGSVEGASDRGGFYEIDRAGVEGQATRFVQTDLDAWHWENMELPAGLRYAPFRYTAPTGEPIEAVAHFGPDGLYGTLKSGPLQDLSDAVLCPAGGRSMAVRLQRDQAFYVGAANVLAKGQFLSGAVLTDRQQRRQDVCRELRTQPESGRLDGPDALLVWARPIDMHFTPVPDARLVGDAVVIAPLRLERTPAGQGVTIPGPLLPCRQLLPAGPARLPSFGSSEADMDLRFQLPPSVLPLEVKHARLDARVSAPGRKLTISGFADGAGAGPVVLKTVESPLDPIHIDVTDERLLRPDADGGLHLSLSLGDAAGKGAAQADDKWTIEYLELEVTGTVK